MIFAALLIHGITPGPFLLKEHAPVFWGVIASMYIGNVMLLVLNLPLVNIFVGILKVPQNILMPVIVLICLIGVYTVNASPLDLLMLAVFGFVGYALRGVGFQVAPLILAMVIGPMLETSLRQSLNITGGNVAGIILRPICLALYILVGLTFILPLAVKFIKKSRLSRREEIPGNMPEK